MHGVLLLIGRFRCSFFQLPRDIRGFPAPLQDRRADEYRCARMPVLPWWSTHSRHADVTMSLPLTEWLAMLLPPSRFYRRRIAQEARSGEPELAFLDQLLPR